MKKIFLALLAISIIFTYISCSEKSKGENNEMANAEETKIDDTYVEESKVETPVETPKEKLSKFVVKNGGYDEETKRYVFIKDASSVEDATAYFGILYNQDDDEMSFNFYKSSDSAEDSQATIMTTATLGSNQSDSTMEVSLILEYETYEISAFGKIYPEQISMDNIEILNTVYFFNDTLLSDTELTQSVYSMFELGMKKLIIYLYATLDEIPDITIQELGFTNLAINT